MIRYPGSDLSRGSRSRTPSRDAVIRRRDQDLRARWRRRESESGNPQPGSESPRDETECVARVDLAQRVEPARFADAVGERIDRERSAVTETSQRGAGRGDKLAEPRVLGSKQLRW